MSEQLLSILKARLEEFATGQGDPEARRNALKEVLQLYILSFLYHHPLYSNWVMYGGSALRIIHGLDRMSVDLDFEVPSPITEKFLTSLKEDIEHYFANTYNSGADFLEIKITGTRGLTLKFKVASLELGHASKQVHVKIDLNHFTARKTVTERRPITQGQLSFVILTYNMSALMASKIAAIFLRGTRGVGESVYEEKGRDIYDLLWYMERKVMPDFDYLAAKGIDMRDPRVLFDKLTLKMNDVSNDNLKQDLFPLFMDRSFIENWIGSWRESYLRLVEQYRIRTVTELDRIFIKRDFYTDNFSFTFWYQTEEGGTVRITCIVSEYWIIFAEGELRIDIDKKLDSKIQLSTTNWPPNSDKPERLKKYATLFYRKVEGYFKKMSRIMLGDQIVTKVIRMSADNFNPREQIILNPSALLSSELEDLLK
jgi:predicted nucleotidyltransferase component of viral defense system